MLYMNAVYEEKKNLLKEILAILAPLGRRLVHLARRTCFGFLHRQVGAWVTQTIYRHRDKGLTQSALRTVAMVLMLSPVRISNSGD